MGWPAWHKGYAVLTSVALVAAALALMALWFAAALLFRLRFQFNLRSLLLLVVVVALPCSWLAVERGKAKEQEAMVKVIETTGGRVKYDYQPWEDSGFVPDSSESPGPAWLRATLGDDFLAHVAFVSFSQSRDSDHLLEPLKELPKLQALDLTMSEITDAGLERLEGATRLTRLWLRYTNVTNRGLKHLQGLTQLHELALSGADVSDAGLEHVQGLTGTGNTVAGRHPRHGHRVSIP